jgi:hypothetical protein
MKSGFADPASAFQLKTAFLHSLDPKAISDQRN